MASSLRSRLALIALIGLFLIPVITSSLNGLTHVITCTADTRTPFTVNLPSSGPPTITSAETFDRSSVRGLCGGLALSMGVASRQRGMVRVLLPVSNHTRYRWHGTVRLVVGGTSVPFGIGTVAPGATAISHVDLAVGSGVTQITGSLLIGP